MSPAVLITRDSRASRKQRTVWKANTPARCWAVSRCPNQRLAENIRICAALFGARGWPDSRNYFDKLTVRCLQTKGFLIISVFCVQVHNCSFTWQWFACQITSVHLMNIHIYYLWPSAADGGCQPVENGTGVDGSQHCTHPEICAREVRLQSSSR